MKKTKKQAFDIPFIGYDYGKNYGWDFDVLFGQYGNPIIGIRIKNIVEQYSADPDNYLNFHTVLNQVVSIIGEGRIVQKLDIFSKKKYTAEPSHQFLQQKYSEHFDGRLFKTIETVLLFTDIVDDKLKKKNKHYQYSEKSYKELRDKCQKVLMLLKQSGCEPQFLWEKDFEYYISGVLAMQFTETPAFDNIKSTNEYLQIGNRFVKNISYVDVENIDLPSEIEPYSFLGGNGAAAETAVDNFTFINELEDYETIIYNQVISIPPQAQQQRELDKKKKKHEGAANNSPSNAIIAEEIQTLLHNIAIDGQLVVNAHFSLIFSTDTLEKMEGIQSMIENKLFTKGIIVSKNAYNQLELFRSAIPGNATELREYDLFMTTSEAALCFFFKESYPVNEESNFYLRFTDRQGVPLKIDPADLPMKTGRINNRNKFVLGPSGSGKSFFTNHMVRQYYEQGAHVLLVDTGNSYQGLCELIKGKTKGEDGVYFTYTEDNPIAFNPFYTDDGVFDIEKRESIKTLILTLWKRDDEPPTRSEEVALSNAVSGYIERIKQEDIYPSFNGFYEYVQGDYRKVLEEKQVREKDFDIANFLNVLEPYYKGGEYDYLLNSDKQLDLLSKRFIVFEIDAIKDHKILFPIVTIIIMEVFINKMRRLKGIRKLILIEEAWKAIAKEGMAEYIKYLFKTVRKFFGEAIVVTQEVDDIIQSPIVKESIINNSDCKILLDQRKYMNKFDDIQAMLGLTDKEKGQVLSINMNNDASRLYKEVWIGLGGTHSAVYATEVSLEEYLAYTTEETEKMEVMQLAAELDGNVELAIKHIAMERRDKANQ